MREHEGTHDVTAPGVGHETRDISTRVVVVFAASLMVGAVVVFLVVWALFLLYGSMQARAYPQPSPMVRVGPPATPPAPRLQTQPREELKKMRAEEERYLHSYGWVDAAGGTVHIPIDHAMGLVLQQGLPTRPQPAGGEPAGMPARSSSGRAPASSKR